MSQAALSSSQSNSRSYRSRGMSPLSKRALRLTPVAAAMLMVLGGIGASNVSAQTKPVTGAWFAAKGGQAHGVARGGPMPGVPNGGANPAARQQAQARQKLARSVENLGRSAAAIAAQQAAQKAARAAAAGNPSVPDGHVQGGVWDRDAGGNLHTWTGAERPVHTQTGGKHNIAIKQTDSKAVLNWETFNVGRNTTVEFQQQKTDAVLNRVDGADMAPSQIQGAIKGDGTVMVVNQNGVVFSGTSQVNVRNLVTAAGTITDEQFNNNGLYNGNSPTFTDAAGKVVVERGAQIATHAPAASTQGGGYVLLLGKEVHNDGTLAAQAGQVAMAAGDNFVIKKGQGTEGNQQSTTRGNEIQAGGTGAVRNTGLIQAPTGDISLTATELRQEGVAVATTSTSQRGTVHLKATGADGAVILGKDSVTAILLDESDATALDNQRDGLLGPVVDPGTGNIVPADPTRRDLSLVDIESGGTVDFEGDSLTLATGGQIMVDAAQRTLVRDGAELDVSGALGVKVAMDSNNLKINVQGNEMRDAPVNRDSDPENGRSLISSTDVWLDRRDLVLVPAGTNGYETDRWYTAGGLLEVSGYLATSGRSVGEWMAQGGIVQFTGNDVVTQAGSHINLSGGTLDVQDGYLRQSWLRGADGRLYEASRAPGDLLYSGLYRGFEATSERWGHTRTFYNPLIAPSRRFEPGYTVGRDAGKLVIGTRNAVLEGQIVGETFQGDRQTQAAQAGIDGYYQSQKAVARRGQLIVGDYTPYYVKDSGTLQYRLTANDQTIRDVILGNTAEQIAAGLALSTVQPEEREGKLYLNSDDLNAANLGGLQIAAGNTITVENDLNVAHGGAITLYGPAVNVNADLTAHSGAIHLGNVLNQIGVNNTNIQDVPVYAPSGTASVTVADGATINASGLWSNLLLEPNNYALLPYQNGGSVSIRSSGDITLSEGSLIDVSSGAALLADGGQQGGHGGNVALHAGLLSQSGKLAMDGAIQGHGVNGSGTLSLQAGSAVYIGDEAILESGYLEAGEPAPIAVLLDEPITQGKGEVLLADARYNQVVAGQTLVSPITFTDTGNTLSISVGPGGWNLADGVLTDMDVYVGSTRYRTLRGETVPEGAVITRINAGTLPAGYELPDSLAVLPTPTYTVTVGQVAPMDTVLAEGTAVAAGAIFSNRVAIQSPLNLTADFFNKGFGYYDVVGQYGLTVADGTQVNVTMPVLRINEQARGQTTGADIRLASEQWTPPLYLEDPINARLTQRQGAGLNLQAGSEQSRIGDMPNVQAVVGKGAQINVDPGQSIAVRSIGQLTVDGRLNAWGGDIVLDSVAPTGANTELERAEAAGHGRSIWIGENAILDVAGRAVTATDARGNRYAEVNRGGSLVIGGEFDPATGMADAANLFVVVRDGALLDASGSSAVLDVPGQGAINVASAGGDITLASSHGLYLDGTLLANSGGAGAAGGSLTTALEAPIYRVSGGINPEERVRQAREFILTKTSTGIGLATGIDAGAAADSLTYGRGQLGADQVEAGGFDNFTLLSNGLLSFDGDLSLVMGQSLNLYAGAFGLTDTAADDTRVELFAPYVRLAGAGATSPLDNYMQATIRGGLTSLSEQAPAGMFTVQAGQLLELRDGTAFGVRDGAKINNWGDPQDLLLEVVDRRAFDNVELVSQGDLRFLATTVSGGTVLNTPGDLTLAAAQIYPATGASAVVYAGWKGGTTQYDPERILTLLRTTEEVPDVPHSVFGSLVLGADTIEQGGILRAPLGSVQVGESPGSSRTTKVVNLLDGSLTSASAAGLVMPYGGTTDGLTWQYSGDKVQLQGVGTLAAGSVTLSGHLVDVQEGAVIDLSGGGQLTGAGFVSGRGGSTDARYNPLVQIGSDGFMLPGLDSNPVYAIVPGVQGVAPVGGEAGAVDPNVGQQLTIGAGVPGLPAGTYTLLPSTYALLPGAYRVEVNGLAGRGAVAPVTPMRNGSFAASGIMSIAGTGIRDSLASQLIVTPADTLRTYSQYNETSYTDFVRADAARLGVPRALIEADAKSLRLHFASRDTDKDELSLRFDGNVLGEAAEGGYGSTLAITALSLRDRIEILSDGGLPSEDYATALRASDLDNIAVNRLTIGGTPRVNYGQGGNMLLVDDGNPVAGITVRSGAVLTAPEVMLISTGLQSDSSSAIEIEQGAVINTLGQGDAAYDSNDGFIYQPGKASVVAVSNGTLQWLAPESSGNSGPGHIRIGGCATVDCTGTTQLYSEGSISFVTNNDFELDDNVRYGTRHLSLGVGSFNIGSTEALAAAAARNAMTPGLALNQQVMERLLQGDTSVGAPALETLELIAANSVNFFDSVTLSTLDANGKSLLDNLLLTTPAIYGYGDASDVALIETGHLIWNGSGDTPGAVVSDGAGTGSGSLTVDAERIIFGYGPWGQPDGISSLDRLALGFANVNLNASDSITANNKGTLAVYQSQSAYVPGEGVSYQGGNLNITTPLITGEAGSVNNITAGGAITVAAPATGAANPAALSALGAEFSLTAGQGLSLDATVALPSGKLTLAGTGDLTLGDNAHLDLSGRSVEFFDDEDATQYSWGGDVNLESTAGNIRLSAGSIIDLSAQHNQGGRLTAIALAEAAGLVDLQGQILAGASDYYEAGGTYVPYLAGGITLRAQHLGNDLTGAFAALNQRLNYGSVNGLRSFQIKRGNLTIGNEVKANQVEVSLDNGHLTVAGIVDASSERVGAIRLAAKNGLTLASNAVLDAHGTMLRLDSYGQIIDAPNRAMVELNSGDGRLTLANGARIDLRHGTDDARVAADPRLHDGRNRGTVELFVPRLGGAVSGDADIDASGSLSIQGARSIAVNTVQRYDDAAYGTDAAASGKPYQVIDQAYLDAKHADSTAFINAALQNTNLLNTKLAGLNTSAYANAFHLRPGVEIISKTADGDLVVSGDLDLSGHRYASLNPHTQKTTVYGSGEAGALVIRAGGDLNIYGSINDGFAPPPDTPDDNGWVLTPGEQAYGGDVIVPGAGVQLAKGTVFPVNKTLNYAVSINAFNLPANTELPVQGVLASGLTLPANTVLSADIRDAGGNVLYAAGTLLEQDTTLPRGSRLDAGSRVPANASLTAMTWPAGVALPAAVTLAANTTLPVGGLIPSMTDVKLVGDAMSVPLRSVNGESMGRNWAVAAMLPEGSQSWGMRLVAGADTQAADPRLTRQNATGRLVLADTHYSLFNQREAIAAGGETVLVWLEGNWYGQEPGTPVTDDWSWACDEWNCTEVTLAPEPIQVWLEGNWYGQEPGTPVTDDWAWACDEWNCVMHAPPAPDPILVWLEGNWYGQEPGTPVTDDWSWACDEWNCVAQAPETGGWSDPIAVYPMAQNFSVLRTGTGDLDLIAAGDVSMQSLYGVYTAGTSTASRAGEAAGGFNRARSQTDPENGIYLNTGASSDPDGGAGYEALVNGGADSTYAAWYPDGGGNLLLRTGGNLTGDLIGTYSPAWDGQELRRQRSSVNQGNWLWRQGSGDTAGVDPTATSWWINFGTYVPGSTVSNKNYGLDTTAEAAASSIPELVGFTGIGTLGGGNLTVDVSGDAGMLNRRGVSHNDVPRSEGLVLAVGSTGRVTETGELLLTGGGDLNLRVGGDLNPGLQARVSDRTRQNLDLNGVLSNLRGGLQLQAGEIGGIGLTYYSTSQVQADRTEIRAFDPYTSSLGTATGGLVLMLGDSAASLTTRGDLVLSGTGDPGRVALPYTREEDGYSWFSLWTENTAIDLFSAGGDLTPSVQLGDVQVNVNIPVQGHNHSNTDGRFVFPSQLSVVAADGSIFMGRSALGGVTDNQFNDTYHLLLTPSANGRLELLAGDSIYAGGYTVSQSGASLDALATPFTPAYAKFPGGMLSTTVHNLSADAQVPDYNKFSLFTFGPNTYSGELVLAQPARLYALNGDIVGLRTGSILEFDSGGRAGQVWYEGAGPVWTRAGGDMVRFGMLLGDSSIMPMDIAYTMADPYFGGGSNTGNLFLHNDISDVSIVEAGGDILYSGFNVSGPGTLEINAGRNILMTGQAGSNYAETAVTSIGPILAGDNRPGASIVMQAGMGDHGADWSGFLDLYLSPANLIDAGLPLADQEGKVAYTYEAELIEWLGERYGFVVSADETAADEALAYFAGLGVEQQRGFARQVYFAELKAGGREFNDPNSPRTGSYLRGRNAIASLFPELSAAGEAVVYQGDLLMYGGSGIHTNTGGDIQLLTPGGGQTFGVEGAAPPSTAGVITRGQGNIQMYSRDSILLGQSRVMTTFGGDILGWSAEGDINAGRGSSTTIVYTPPRRVYDQWGNVTLSPQVPSTGAGIATLNPIAEVEPGDIDLIAPLGTIDAGEAGIRVSGNVNVAALQVLNADNIQVQGDSTGVPVIAAVNVSALSSASAAASSAASAAQDTVARARAEARQNLPSIINVQILGFGNEAPQSVSSGARPADQAASYRPDNLVQVVGRGDLSAAQLSGLTADERKHLDL
ncbi:filamentous hemagglutinin family protein [Alcaligenes sp. NLF5-7]|uniref:filamentous haemagglutinin family protein n=1 Tax=Alcaligenes sp. NLF5-7 TaxID=2918755 RepID=UPI0020C42C53|nr:filamentous haemagglutinin family protein [Alcaligenes sp. NLF5-7]UTM01074.1 filamentous hemagglutinin family protein [Alcaligenes sp. NLF5-7]